MKNIFRDSLKIDKKKEKEDIKRIISKSLLSDVTKGFEDVVKKLPEIIIKETEER